MSEEQFRLSGAVTEAIGFLQFDGIGQVGDANKYGIDVEFESVDASELT
jgi:hypothetical protein